MCLRKTTKKRGVSPRDRALWKFVYLVRCNVSKKWSMRSCAVYRMSLGFHGVGLCAESLGKPARMRFKTSGSATPLRRSLGWHRKSP